MKKALTILAILPLLLIISGCPVGIAYPLGYNGKEKIDKQLIGSWIQSNTEMEVMKMEIEKLNDNTLKLTIKERGAMFMEESDVFRGWCTTIDTQDFVYFQEKDSLGANYYHYAYKFDGKKLITYDMSLLEGGIDAVTSTEAFRAEVIASIKKPEFLSAETIWEKD